MTRILRAEIITGGNWQVHTMDKDQPGEHMWYGEQRQDAANIHRSPQEHVGHLADTMPWVNCMRLPFNRNSFDAAGELPPRTAGLAKAAATRGIGILWVQMDGPSQRATEVVDPGFKTDPAAFRAFLPTLQARHTEAFTKLTAWLQRNHGTLLAGFEAINEPATYDAYWRHHRSDARMAEAQEIYVEHVMNIAAICRRAFPDAPLYVGGWRYSAHFQTLNRYPLRKFGGRVALDVLRAGIRQPLVWSAHLYPDWLEAGEADEVTLDSLRERLGPVLGERIVITETNVQAEQMRPYAGEAGRKALRMMMVQNAGEVTERAEFLDFLAEHRIGLLWWPLVNWARGRVLSIRPAGVHNSHPRAYAQFLYWCWRLDPDRLAGLDLTWRAVKTSNFPGEPDYEAGHANDDVGYAHVRCAGPGETEIRGIPDASCYLIGRRDRTELHPGPNDNFIFGGDGGSTVHPGGKVNLVRTGRGDDVIHAADEYTFVNAGYGRNTIHCRAEVWIYGFDAAAGDRLGFYGAFAGPAAVRAAAGTEPSPFGPDDLVIALPDGGRVTLIDRAGQLDALEGMLADFVGAPADPSPPEATPAPAEAGPEPERLPAMLRALLGR